MERLKRDKLEQQFGSRFGLRRRSAVKQLAADSSAEAVPLLAKGLDDANAKTAALAGEALRELSNREAVDAFCALWAATRDERLATILTDKGYVASAPASLRALTALKNGQQPSAETKDELDALVAALSDRDAAIAGNVAQTLGAIKDRVVTDQLIERAIPEPQGPLARVCAAAKFRHSSDRENSVFLVLTSRADAFFEDFKGHEREGLRLLRQAYDYGDETLRANLMRAVRSGDRRFGLFFELGKARHEMTEQDILTELELRVKQKDWPALFALFCELPMKYGYPLLELFRRSGWEPDNPDLKRLYEHVLRESKGFEVTPGGGKSGGATPGGAVNIKAVLLEILDKAEPLEGMGAVLVLALSSASDDAKLKVATHQHWGVRVAGRATGLCPDTMYKSDAPVLQMNEVRVTQADVRLALGIPALELWPSRATPKDLQALNALPKKAFEGKLGAVRRVLRAVLVDNMRMVDGGVDMAHVHEGAVTGGREREPDMGFE